MRRVRTVLITACLAIMACNAEDPKASETGSSSESNGSESSSGTESTSDSNTSDTTDTDTDTDTDPTTETTDTMMTSPGIDMGSGACDPFDQDCPDGEKCVPFLDDGGTGYKCVPIMGSQAPGQDCVYGGPMEATDDCDETSACWGAKMVNGDLVGTCLPFCTGSADMPVCADGSHCIGGSGDIYLCTEGCDPLLQDCGQGEGCYWSNGEFACLMTTAGLGLGEVCGFTNDCSPGLTCAPAQVVPNCAGSDCCVAFCDVGLGDQQCAAPQTTCNPFLPPAQAPAGYEHIGVCISV